MYFPACLTNRNSSLSPRCLGWNCSLGWVCIDPLRYLSSVKIKVLEISKENINHTQTSGNLMKIQTVWIFVQLCFWLLYFRSIIFSVISIFKIIGWHSEFWLLYLQGWHLHLHGKDTHCPGTWGSSQERECEIQTAGTDLKRFLITVEGLHDSRILGDSSAFGRERVWQAQNPVSISFFLLCCLYQ